MMEGHPEDDDIEGWYSATSCCNENHVANTAFHSASRSAPSVCSSSFPTRFPTMPTCQTITNLVLSSMPTSSVPTPMDVDATKHGGVHTLVCYHCGKMGHLHKNCPQGFDVRF